MAADLVRPDDGRVVAVRFEEVPDQAPLTDDVTVQTASDLSFEARIAALGADLGVDVEADEIVSHDTKHAVVNVADRRGVDAVVAEHEPLRLRSRLLGDPVDWIVRHAPCDVLLVDNLGYDRPTSVVLSGDGGPYSPLAVSVAGTVAAENGGALSLWYPVDHDATDQYERTMADYRDDISAILAAPIQSEAIRADGGQPSVPDVVVRGGTSATLRSVFDDGPVVPSPGCTTITAYPHESRRPSVARRLFERLTF
jgi:nucleotide-binding universal stress UspA family protein